jgi:hypothetical protein
MRRRVVLAFTASVLLAGSATLAQQQPIFGCRTAVSCRPAPISGSALADGSSSGMLLGVGFAWGPGYSWRIVTPPPPPKAQPTATIETRVFHDVHLLPPPEPTVTPSPGAAKSR